MELLWNILALIGLGTVLCFLLFGVWFAIAGDTEDGMLPDDDATLDVQNHWGDSRPVR